MIIPQVPGPVCQPRAMVADNDLALGQIVEALSKVILEEYGNFVTEDDSQDGWDHVSAYRTVGMIISPYTRVPASYTPITTRSPW